MGKEVAVTEWAPATEAEQAMRDALRSGDQEMYFRILSRIELFLPVSADALAGRVPMGWGTWTSGDRTHVLAFTSPQAMAVCLAEHAGSARRIPYHELAQNWPNLDWWLAVNPGLPIEGYLPAWFVTQLARGDVRLPGRGLGVRDRVERVEDFRRTRAVASVPGRQAELPPAPEPERSAARLARRSPVIGAASVGTASAGAASAGAVSAAGVAPVSPASRVTPGNSTTTSGSPPSGAVGSASVPQALPVRTPRTPSSEFGLTPSGSARVPAPPDLAAPPGMPPAAPPPAAPPPAAPPPAAPSGLIAAPAPRFPGSPAAPGSPVAPGSPTAAGSPSAYIPPPAAPPPAASVPAAASAPPVVPVPPSAPPQVPLPSRRTSPGGPLPTRVPAPPSPAFGLTPGSTAAPPQYAEPPLRAAVPAVAPEPTADRVPASPPPPPARVPEPDFDPANDVEASLLNAAEEGNTDAFLSTLLLAKVLVPVLAGTPAGAVPRDPEFGWRVETLDGQPFIVVFTSPERLIEHVGAEIATVTVKFVQLIRNWPDEQWSFAVNPGSPVGAKLPGAQIVALANWADEVGLSGEPSGEIVVEEPAPAPQPQPSPVPAPAPSGPTMMQKVLPPAQVDYYLDRGYDRVSGFVYRVAEVAHLRTPANLLHALGLSLGESPFTLDAAELYVLRWAAHRPNLYRIPYGGQHEAGMRAMQGWVIERAPFRGNGFAPGESGDIIAEFKVDSARLPNGAQLWRISADGTEELVAMLDVDGPLWRRVDA